MIKCRCGHDAEDHHPRQGCMATRWEPRPHRKQICDCTEFRIRPNPHNMETMAGVDVEPFMPTKKAE